MFLIISIVFISLIGTLAHFLYDITDHNKFVGLFAAVNESTWEHIKIALTPTFLWSLVDGILYGSNPNYIIAKEISLLSIIILIPFLFYGHKYVTKKDYFIFDIVIFYLVIIISQVLFHIVLNMNPFGFTINYIAGILLFITFGFYMIMTLLPIEVFIFKDPITGKYGFKAHSEEFSIVNKKKGK